VSKTRDILEGLICLFLGFIGLAIVESDWWYNLWGIDRWEGWVWTRGVKGDG